jgi:hypothetical protein
MVDLAVLRSGAGLALGTGRRLLLEGLAGSVALTPCFRGPSAVTHIKRG